MSETFLAACPPGLEPLLAGEFAALGLRKPQAYFKAGQASASLSFEGPLEAGFTAAYCLRTAERVSLKVGAFRAATFAELESGAARLDWRAYFAEGAPADVKAKIARSRLNHARGAAERLARAARLSLSGDEAAPQVLARVEDDRCEVWLDLGGEPLHRRGYRQETAKAPLRETLAAGLLLDSGWDGRSPLLDPLCGAGTIVIEAALLAAGVWPGARRAHAFTRWRRFSAARWAPPPGRPLGAPTLAGSDRDAGAIEAARANAARAGVASMVTFTRAAVSAAPVPPGNGWLVANPPYGHRVDGQRDVRDVYAQLGKLLRERLPGWRAALVCPSVPLARATGLPFAGGLSTMNGGLDVRFARLGG
jgi:putative N6-adenine-specific DNA methylase